VPVDAISGIKARQIQLTDGLQHRPDEVILRHPVRDQRRHQKHLVAVTTNEPRAHDHKAPDPTGRHPPFPDSLKQKQHRPPDAADLPSVLGEE
jgi:hypothetical protein